jgi:pimeloyl-ACP methyl ester carboxylesterase
MPPPHLLARLAPFVAALTLAATAASQGSLPIGSRAVAWANTTGQGSPALTATVRYPAYAAGVDTAILPYPGGWPVLVFLPGYGAVGTDYLTLADAWVDAGYAVVLSTTCSLDWVCQPLDGIALHAAVLAAIAEPGGPFQDAFHPQRVAVVGHSMGGASVGNVLAANPGYCCGLAIAPITPLGGVEPLVHVPIGIVVGLGDAIAPAPVFAQSYYDNLTPATGLRFLHVMDATADHLNVVGFLPGMAPQPFAVTVAVSTGFFSHCMGIATDGLERVIGPAAQSEPLLHSVQFQAQTPQLWLAGDLQIGAQTRVSIAGEPGIAGLAAAKTVVPSIPTPYGLLHLDPVTAFVAAVGITGPSLRTDILIGIPNDPLLIGLEVALQGLSVTTIDPLLLGSAQQVYVQP